jgi:hypothetical protein
LLEGGFVAFHAHDKSALLFGLGMAIALDAGYCMKMQTAA